MLLPEHLVEPVMKHLHEATYHEPPLLNYSSQVLGISKPTQKTTTRCVVSRKNNSKTDPHQKKEGTQYPNSAYLRTGK